jgi:hypothetical protein
VKERLKKWPEKGERKPPLGIYTYFKLANGPNRRRPESGPIGSSADENIENEAVLVDGTPEPMLLAGEADDDLIEVPFVATARRSPTDAVGEFLAEFEAPLPDRLVRQRDAADSQHLLDHAQAQREPKIQPYRAADDLQLGSDGRRKPGLEASSSRPFTRPTQLLPNLLFANLTVPWIERFGVV